MSKAIIVIDKCDQCPNISFAGNLCGNCRLEHRVCQHDSSIPDWCPLQAMPGEIPNSVLERVLKNIANNPDTNEVLAFLNGAKLGWHYCLFAIGGGDDEQGDTCDG